MTGDFLLVAPGVAHTIASAAGIACRNVHELPYETVGGRAMLLRHGGEGARTVLACGGVRFEDPAAHPLVGLMPQVLHIRADQGRRGSPAPADAGGDGRRGAEPAAWRHDGDAAAGGHPA